MKACSPGLVCHGQSCDFFRWEAANDPWSNPPQTQKRTLMQGAIVERRSTFQQPNGFVWFLVEGNWVRSSKGRDAGAGRWKVGCGLYSRRAMQFCERTVALTCACKWPWGQNKPMWKPQQPRWTSIQANRGEPQLLTVESFCGTLWNLNF